MTEREIEELCELMETAPIEVRHDFLIEHEQKIREHLASIGVPVENSYFSEERYLELRRMGTPDSYYGRNLSAILRGEDPAENLLR